MVYFHCAPLDLEIGSIIQPGNWGRIKRLHEQDGPCVAREVGFEAIRQQEFPTKPSRLDAAFVCPTIDAIRHYRNAYAPATLLYRVELVAPDAASHIGDYQLCIAGFVGINALYDLARRYWSDENHSSPEILTASPLRIIEKVAG